MKSNGKKIKVLAKPYMHHLYIKQRRMEKELAKKLNISASQVVREAIEEKHAFHFNR